MDKERTDFERKGWGKAYLGLFDGTVAEGWFKWAEWLLVTAALYALARAGQSRVFEILAYVSALLTCFYGLHKIEGAAIALKPSLLRGPFLLRAVLGLLLLLGFLALTVAMTSAIDMALY